MGEDFVLDYGGVVVHEDIFNGDSGDLSEKYASECVGDGGIDADEREGSMEGVILVELDLERLRKNELKVLRLAHGLYEGKLIEQMFMTNSYSLP